MRKLVSLMLSIALLLTMVAPAMARTPDEIMQIRQYLSNQINVLHSTDKMSNDEVYSVHVDLSSISKSSVVATVYKTVYENSSITSYDNIKIQPIQGINGAHDKLTRFWAYLDNNDDENFCAQWGSAPEDSVIGYVYGTTKDQTLSAFVAGIPECLEQQRLYHNPGGGGGIGSSGKTPDEAQPETPNPDAWAEKYRTTVFAIDQTSYTVATVSATGTTINEEESITPVVQTMDVAPYIRENRTYVPVRYLAYALGVAEDGVTWDGNARRVGISKDDTDIALIIGNPVMYVDKKPVKMDVSPEITNDRTFLPARWVAEALGAEVEWDDATKQAIIKMPIESED
jgi:hypothetical protein